VRDLDAALPLLELDEEDADIGAELRCNVRVELKCNVRMELGAVLGCGRDGGVASGHSLNEMEKTSGWSLATTSGAASGRSSEHGGDGGDRVAVSDHISFSRMVPNL
jgi:hypothetical protein